LKKISDIVLKPNDLLLLELSIIKSDTNKRDAKKKAKKDYSGVKFRSFAICSLLQATDLDLYKSHKNWYHVDVRKSNLMKIKRNKSIEDFCFL